MVAKLRRARVMTVDVNIRGLVVEIRLSARRADRVLAQQQQMTDEHGDGDARGAWRGGGPACSRAASEIRP